MANRILTWSQIDIPDHEGVVQVGGRVGAAGGPRAFGRMLSRMKGRDRVHESLARHETVTGLTSDVVSNLENAAEVIRSCHSAHPLSVVVGGGHDHGYSHLLGIKKALKTDRLGCINIDAHLDVRKAHPVMTSGSPFYLALENQVIAPDRFIEFGIQRHCNAVELWDYIDARKVEVVPLEALRGGNAAGAFARSLEKLSLTCDAIVVSLDLDAAAQAHAPGVSAPQAEGFTPSEILEMMALAGANPKAASLGIFELNPEHDIDDRTARLAATSAWHFVASALTARQGG